MLRKFILRFSITLMDGTTLKEFILHRAEDRLEKTYITSAKKGLTDKPLFKKLCDFCASPLSLVHTTDVKMQDSIIRIVF